MLLLNPPLKPTRVGMLSMGASVTSMHHLSAMSLVHRSPFPHFNLQLSSRPCVYHLTRSRGLPGSYKGWILSRNRHSRGYHTEFTDPNTQPPTLTRSVIIPGDEKFKVLFMGRDEFSCLVLKELHSASGLSPFATFFESSLKK